MTTGDPDHELARFVQLLNASGKIDAGEPTELSEEQWRQYGFDQQPTQGELVRKQSEQMFRALVEQEAAASVYEGGSTTVNGGAQTIGLDSVGDIETSAFTFVGPGLETEIEGRYRVSGAASFSGDSGVGWVDVELRVEAGGAPVDGAKGVQSVENANHHSIATGTAVVDLNAGETLRLVAETSGTVYSEPGTASLFAERGRPI